MTTSTSSSAQFQPHQRPRARAERVGFTDTEPRSIRENNPDNPEWLCAVVQKLMAKHADDRYGSATEVADVSSGFNPPILCVGPTHEWH